MQLHNKYKVFAFCVPMILVACACANIQTLDLLDFLSLKNPCRLNEQAVQLFHLDIPNVKWQHEGTQHLQGHETRARMCTFFKYSHGIGAEARNGWRAHLHTYTRALAQD